MTQPLKVLHVITTTDLGGAEVQLLGLIAKSDHRQMRHHVVCLRPRGVLAAQMEQAGATLQSMDLSASPVLLPRGILALRRIIQRAEPHVINSWLYHANLLAVLANPKDGAPILWGLYNSALDPKFLSLNSRMVMRACAWLSKRPRGIMANSQEGKSYHLGEGYPASRFEVIVNGFDTERFRPDPRERQRRRQELGLGPERILLGLVGRYDPVKNHAGFLRAAAKAAGQRPELAFVSLGTEVVPSNPALAQALREPLAGRCFLLGESEEVPQWLTAMDAHVLCSFSEGFSNAIGEAMAVGLPQIVTDVGASAYLVGGCGIVIPPDDEDALVRAMVDMVDIGQAGRQAMGQKARQRIKEHFSLEHNVAQYYSLYQQMMASAPSTASY